MAVKNAVLGIGRPICGKATSLLRYCLEFGGCYIDMGATLRAVMKRLSGDKSPVERADEAFVGHLLAGKAGSIDLDALRPLIETGNVTNAVIIPIIREWIHLHRRDKLLVIDGAPRDVQQARFMIRFLHGNGFNIKTVWFSTPASECLKRAARGGREDETPEKRAKRMADFERDTEPVYPIVRTRTELVDIDNTFLAPAETYELIKTGLGLKKPVSPKQDFIVPTAFQTA